MSDDVTGAAQVAVPEGYETNDWRRGFGRAVGPLYTKLQPDGSRTFGVRIEEHHANGMMNAHGGLLMTLADMAWGNVVSVQRSSFWVTVRLTCDFLSSAKVGEWVEGGGEIVAGGADAGDLYTVRGRIWCGERTLITGTGLFKALGAREPRPGERAYVAAHAGAAA